MKNRKTQEVQLSNTEFERLNQYRIDIGQEPIDDPIPNTDKKYTDARQLENSRLKDKMLAERVAKAKAKETTEAREAREAKEAEEIREVEEIKKAREAREAEEALRKKNKKTTEEVKVKKEKMSDDEDLYGGN